MGLNLRLPQWFSYVNELQTPKPPDQPSRASLIFFVRSVSIHNSVGVVCPCLSLQHFRQPLALSVGVVPEVEEEEQENQAIETNDVDEDGELVWAVLHEEILGDVAGYHNKLDLGSYKERIGGCQLPRLSTSLSKHSLNGKMYKQP